LIRRSKFRVRAFASFSRSAAAGGSCQTRSALHGRDCAKGIECGDRTKGKRYSGPRRSRDRGLLACGRLYVLAGGVDFLTLGEPRARRKHA